MPHLPLCVHMPRLAAAQARELAFAVKMYAAASEQSGYAHNYDLQYNHGLVLQEMAGKMAAGSPDHIRLLQEVRQRGLGRGGQHQEP